MVEVNSDVQRGMTHIAYQINNEIEKHSLDSCQFGTGPCEHLGIHVFLLNIHNFSLSSDKVPLETMIEWDKNHTLP